MQLIIDIKNDSLSDKIIQLLNIFKNDGVEIKETIPQQANSKGKQQETDLSDKYIEKNWEQIIRGAYVSDDYYKSEQYIEDRVKDLKERGKI